VAVIGPNANDSVMMWGNYNGFPRHTVTILEGIQAKGHVVGHMKACELVQNSSRTLHGTDGQPEVDYGHDNALRLRTDDASNTTVSEVMDCVRDADVVIFAGGISPRLEGEEMRIDLPGFRGGDRTNIELPKVQREMIADLKALGKKVVYVNCSGSAIGMVPESEHVNAILQAWYGGEKGGEAVADVLFGDYNPGGKLPVTFYQNVEQLPDFEDYTMKGRTYRYFEGKPLFPFGYGLSYTSFKLSKPKYRNGKVCLTVTNTGSRDGSEVVQVYIRNPKDTEGPLKTLRAYQRVEVKAGQQKQVEIPLPREQFELWDAETNTMRVKAGKYEVMAGTSSADNDLRKINVTIK